MITEEITEEKKAIAAKEAEAVKLAAEIDVKAKEIAEAAKAAVKVDAKVEAVASLKVAETAKATDVDSSSSAPSGGRVLPKEEVSAETMAFLKTLKK
jgi:phage I-like protein